VFATANQTCKAVAASRHRLGAFLLDKSTDTEILGKIEMNVLFILGIKAI
jgi:hypothetical protein